MAHCDVDNSICQQIIKICSIWRQCTLSSTLRLPSTNSWRCIQIQILDERLKSCNDTLEKMKVSLEAQIDQLQKDLPESIDEENKVLKKVIEEQDKLIKKNSEKHKQEVNEFKRQAMSSKENLRAAIKEREVLRENDRILLNTFDMMKKYPQEK